MNRFGVQVYIKYLHVITFYVLYDARDAETLQGSD